MQMRGNRRRFAAWVRQYGTTQLARDLKTQRSTVHSWVAGRDGAFIAPATSFIARIIDLSTATPFELGPLTYDDILAGTSGLRGQQGEGKAANTPPPTKKNLKRFTTTAETGQSVRLERTGRPIASQNVPQGTASELLKLPEVLQRCQLSRTSVYRLMANARFPRTCKLADRAVAWREADVTAWLAARAGQSSPRVRNRKSVRG